MERMPRNRGGLLPRTNPANPADPAAGRRLLARRGATPTFPAGPWLPAPAQLSSDFSCFLTAPTSGGSRSHADLVSSVVLRSVLCRPKSVPHHLLPETISVAFSLASFSRSRSRGFTFLRIPGYRSEASHLCLITTLTAAPLGHSQSSSALWDLPEPSPDHLVRPKPNHLLFLKTRFQSRLNVLHSNTKADILVISNSFLSPLSISHFPAPVVLSPKFSLCDSSPSLCPPQAYQTFSPDPSPESGLRTFFPASLHNVTRLPFLNRSLT